MTTATLTQSPDTVLVGSPTACMVAGITYRQLDYWIRTGLFSPQVEASGSGSRRRFSPADLRALAAISEASDVLSSYNTADRGFGGFDQHMVDQLCALARDEDTEGALVLANRVEPLGSVVDLDLAAELRRGPASVFAFVPMGEIVEGIRVAQESPKPRRFPPVRVPDYPPDW